MVKLWIIMSVVIIMSGLYVLFIIIDSIGQVRIIVEIFNIIYGSWWLYLLDNYFKSGIVIKLIMEFVINVLVGIDLLNNNVWIKYLVRKVWISLEFFVCLKCKFVVS